MLCNKRADKIFGILYRRMLHFRLTLNNTVIANKR